MSFIRCSVRAARLSEWLALGWLHVYSARSWRHGYQVAVIEWAGPTDAAPWGTP
jgi:hypothetical protein